MVRSAADVSIITVNWNGRVHLETLLPTLVPLGAKEVIVVDNGSTDDSVGWLNRFYPKVRVIRNAVNRGFAHPNNLAAQKADGSVLALINNDMKADSAWIEEGLKGLRHSKCTACRILDWDGDRIDFNGSSMQYLGYAVNRDAGMLADQVTAGDSVLFPCGGAMLVDREVFLDAGGFDEDFFAIFEDVDLGWRLWLMGHTVSYTPTSKVFHKGHATFNQNHEAKMRYLMHRNALLTILKNYEDDLFRKIVPTALLMAVRRAVRLSRVQRESFYIWEDVKSRLEARDPSAYTDLLDSLNHLVAVDDVIRLLPQMLAKRDQIQAVRKRSDKEILDLFGDPLRAIVEDYDYAETEITHLRRIGMEEIFDIRGYEKDAARFHHPLALQIQGLREELRAIQWVGTAEILSPGTSTRGSRASKFYRAVKAYGLLRALAMAWESLRREP